MKESRAFIFVVVLTCKYVFIFKEFAIDYSKVSFEQCRVVLVVCRFSDHKYRHGNVYVDATCKKTE